jgi:hypothetical protein
MGFAQESGESEFAPVKPDQPPKHKGAAVQLFEYSRSLAALRAAPASITI